MLETYFKDIFNTMKAGGVTEESYYPDLKGLLENWAKKDKKKFYITPIPKRTEAGNPDFRILTAKKELVGYIEAKDTTIENLDHIESTEQLKRYRDTFPNLILTNYFEFRLYQNGQMIEKVTVGRPFLIHKLKTVPPVENQEKFLKLIEKFFAFSIPKTYTAKALAIELAKRTRFLRDNLIAEELKEEDIEGIQTLEGFYKAFKDHLIATLTVNDFANLFAQTITYGLFAARSRAENGFNRNLAYQYIPQTIGILRDVFRFISSTDLPVSMEWIIDDIAEVLASANIKKIIGDFHKKGKGRDPIIHFYETFLAEYDPKEREKRGVYYTPESVVSYIVRSINLLLKEKFGKSEGFATPSVTVLDPAAGTLTFPVRAIFEAVDEYKKKYGDGGIRGLIKEHILKNFYAFELMMAPYAIGHLKVSFALTELNCKLAEDERFQLYLTNTLDTKILHQSEIPGVSSLSEESKLAGKVKTEIPIMVIMGNPPYSGTSDNKQKWILKLIDDYKKIDGKSLGERNPKWIQDDYVKFFRFSQWKIEQNKAGGILGFITNHAWLDNPTFRGMRHSMLETFDEIYILNLHGSTLKKEKTPKGGKDENVFDIQPGVAIAICVKKESGADKKVFYGDRWGLREEKYNWLEKNDIKKTKWQTLSPQDPYYFFVPKEEKGFDEYKSFQKITDIFPLNSVGVVTGRDDFVIDENRRSLETRIRQFRDSTDSDDLIKEMFGLKDKPVSKWFVAKARERVRNDSDWENKFVDMAYRPFDERWIYYENSLVERGRENVMRHMLKPNLALITMRQVALDQDYTHCIASDKIIDNRFFVSAKGIIQQIPLYLYNKEEKQQTIFSGQEKLDIKGSQHTLRKKEKRVPNIAPEVFEKLKKFFKKEVSPEDIFHYIYAILYSESYRRKYQEFLKIDFPRIPFTKDAKLFTKIADLGKKLTGLHLLKSPDLNNLVVKFFGKDSNKLEKREYSEKDEKVYINESQYFGNVKKEVWNYHIGGYQVMDKWLKDRKRNTLSSDDIKHYCRFATALAKTIEIQKEIDKLYSKVEGNIIEITSI